MKPALQELVRLLAEVAVEKYLDEVGTGIEQQSQGDRPRPELNEALAGQSVQEGPSYG